MRIMASISMISPRALFLSFFPPRQSKSQREDTRAKLLTNLYCKRYQLLMYRHTAMQYRHDDRELKVSTSDRLLRIQNPWAHRMVCSYFHIGVLVKIKIVAKRTAGCNLFEGNISVLFSGQGAEMRSIHLSLKEKSSVWDLFFKITKLIAELIAALQGLHVSAPWYFCFFVFVFARGHLFSTFSWNKFMVAKI